MSEVDGYGQFTFSFDDLGLVEKTIEDSFIDSTGAVKNTNMGSEANITVGSSSSSDQYGLLRLNLDDVGMHHNSSLFLPLYPWIEFLSVVQPRSVSTSWMEKIGLNPV